MNHEPVLILTSCAICGSNVLADELYPANFSPEHFNPDIFSARRIPDKIHYRIVRCKKCGLVRSDPILNQDVLVELYAKSAQTYDQEVPNLNETYGGYLDRAIRVLFGSTSGSNHDRTLLEIGCGSGFFLEEALKRGFIDVMGVEPSRQAVEKSPTNIQSKITCDIMRPGLFTEEQFDLICMFQVFDHITDPGTLLDECFKTLKPGGGVLCLNHDVSALPARLLGERSPIIDIEHTYLYSKNTIEKLFTAHGFITGEVGSAINICSIRYLFQLLPIHNKIKFSSLTFLSNHTIGQIKLEVELGNLYLIARKPKFK